MILLSTYCSMLPRAALVVAGNMDMQDLRSVRRRPQRTSIVPLEADLCFFNPLILKRKARDCFISVQEAAF